MDQPPSSASDTAAETATATATTACCSAADTVSFEAIEQDVTVFSALANPTRYGALRVLAGADGEVCACNLAPPLDVSQSTVSHALSALYSVGLVDRRKEGRWRYYSLTSRAETLLETLDATRRAANE